MRKRILFKEAISFSAFLASFRTKVTRKRGERALNLVLSLFFLMTIAKIQVILIKIPNRMMVLPLVDLSWAMVKNSLTSKICFGYMDNKLVSEAQ